MIHPLYKAQKQDEKGLRYPQITGWGKYVPSRVLTNGDLEKMVETSDEWIRSRTGIRERRIAGDEETASTMGLEAGRRALEVAGLHPEELDLVIAATVTPERVFPCCAALIQHGLGARQAAAFDLSAACSGFIYALTTASQFITAGTYRKVLVVGTEVYSRILNWQDRSTCVLFADGAGAVVVEAGDRPGPLSYVLGSDGSGGDFLYLMGQCASPQDALNNGHHFLTMNGHEVFRFAVTIMADATRQAVEAAGLQMSDINLFVPHQANERIIKAAAKALRIPYSKVFMNVERYGNTSSASIPIALCEAVEEGRVKDGDLVAIVGFGAGLTWAAMVIQWAAGK